METNTVRIELFIIFTERCFFFFLETNLNYKLPIYKFISKMKTAKRNILYKSKIFGSFHQLQKSMCTVTGLCAQELDKDYGEAFLAALSYECKSLFKATLMFL